MTQSKESKVILIIDDQSNIEDALCEALRGAGYRVFSAGNGREGLFHCQNFGPPDLILLDWLMPEMNGREFLDLASRLISLDRTRVVVLSTLADPAAFKHPMIRACLRKPVRLAELLRCVGEHLLPV